MHNPFRSVLRWLRRPVVSRRPLTLEQALSGSYEPATVDIMLEKLEQEWKGHLERAHRIDRKLLALITADGVYGGILASIRDSIPAAVVVVMGLVAAASLALAYLAWRPHLYQVVSVAKLVPFMEISADDLNRALIAAHDWVNEDIDTINRWKEEKLTWATWLFAVVALPTFLMNVLLS